MISEKFADQQKNQAMNISKMKSLFRDWKNKLIKSTSPSYPHPYINKKRSCASTSKTVVANNAAKDQIIGPQMEYDIFFNKDL